jgi:DNA invertase Pin-like site-specific DNA recombinase
MFEAINGMMLDMLAAVARKDYEDRRRWQYQGQAKAKAGGKYVGRPENKRRNLASPRCWRLGLPTAMCRLPSDVAAPQ